MVVGLLECELGVVMVCFLLALLCYVPLQGSDSLSGDVINQEFFIKGSSCLPLSPNEQDVLLRFFSEYGVLLDGNNEQILRYSLGRGIGYVGVLHDNDESEYNICKIYFDNVERQGRMCDVLCVYYPRNGKALCIPYRHIAEQVVRVIEELHKNEPLVAKGILLSVVATASVRYGDDVRSYLVDYAGSQAYSEQEVSLSDMKNIMEGESYA